MHLSLLFVSDSRIAPAARSRELARIVDSTLRNNGWLHLSGALVCSRSRFCQLIEGPDASVQLMMRRIAADPRHGNLRTVRVEWREERRIGGWRLAYSGVSHFVDRVIGEAATAAPGAPDQAARIDLLLTLLAGDDRPC